MTTVDRLSRFAAQLAERSGGGWLVIGPGGSVREGGGIFSDAMDDSGQDDWLLLLASRNRDAAREWLERIHREGSEADFSACLAERPGDHLTASAVLVGPDDDVLVAFVPKIPPHGAEEAGGSDQTSDPQAACPSTQRLESHLNMLETLLEAIPNPVFYKDAEGIYRGCNTSFSKRVLGLPKRRIIGKRMHELNEWIPPDLGRIYHEKDMELLRSGGIQNYDAKVRCADGTEREFSFCKAVFQNDDGEAGGIVGVMWDISERKRRQREVEGLLQEKSELLREVHHRVKNNLQIIASLLSLQMARVPQNAEFLRLTRETQGRVFSMALVHDELYDSGNFVEIDLFSYAEKLLSRHAGLAAGVRILGRVEGDRVPLPLVQAIPCGLLLNELIHNAVAHAFPGRSEGRITAFLAEEGEQLRMEIRDDGVGMSPTLLHGEPSTLGFQVVHSLVEQLRGGLEILPEQGTTLVLRFPRWRGERPRQPVSGRA